jgi:hypothetical protein
MQLARTTTVLALIATAACSGSRLPSIGVEPDPALAEASRLITEAQAAGADTLAVDAYNSAKQNLAAATADRRKNDKNRAALKARQAAADATYARAEADRVRADRARSDAQRALSALPPAGGSR